MTTIEEFKEKSDVIVQKLKETLAGIRASRPNPAFLENIKVEYYNQLVPLKQVGSFSVIPPREITVSVWDKDAVKNVIQAIESSALGFSVNADGNTVRVFLPELSRERREELIKYVKKEAEIFRIQIRHLRDEINKKIQSLALSGELSEDQKFKAKDEVQKSTDRVNDEIELIVSGKIQEISG